MVVAQAIARKALVDGEPPLGQGCASGASWFNPAIYVPLSLHVPVSLSFLSASWQCCGGKALKGQSFFNV